VGLGKEIRRYIGRPFLFDTNLMPHYFATAHYLHYIATTPPFIIMKLSLPALLIAIGAVNAQESPR